MPKPESDDTPPLLFCPFCRECYEGERECPEHELALVPFEKLPREDDHEALPTLDRAVDWFDPRFGRGLVMGGIVLSLVGFFSPFFEVVFDERSRVWSGLEAASSRAPNLWTIPFVAAMFFWILARQRTPVAMRGVRLAGIVLAIAPLISLGYTVFKVEQGAAQITERTGQSVHVSLEYGIAVTVLAALLLFVGSLRLGVLPATHGASYVEVESPSRATGRDRAHDAGRCEKTTRPHVDS